MQENSNNSQLAWLKLGINTIDQYGLAELKINELCQKLNVTKGSFYHWFKSKNDFEMQLLEFWKQRFTSTFIENAEAGNTDCEKLSLLGRQCIDGAINGNRLEFEINAWSFKNKKAAITEMTTPTQRTPLRYFLRSHASFSGYRFPVSKLLRNTWRLPFPRDSDSSLCSAFRMELNTHPFVTRGSQGSLWHCKAQSWSVTQPLRPRANHIYVEHP